MVLTFGSHTASELASKKLQDLRDFLTKKSLQLSNEKGKNGTPGVAQSIFVAESLFLRAPSDYLESTGIEELASISSIAAEFYREHLKSNKEFSIRIENNAAPAAENNTTLIFTAMSDRPFIVDTLTELLRVNKLRHHVLLHPIVREDDGKLTSLTYFEVDRVEDPAQLQQLKNEIDSRFNDLLLVCGDFPETLRQVDKLTNAIQLTEPSPGTERQEIQENVSFLKWLTDGGFVFLGFQEFVCETTSPGALFKPIPESVLGLFRSSESKFSPELLDLESHFRFHEQQPSAICISKLVSESPVHRYGRMDLITLKVPRGKSSDTCLAAFLGLFTSKAMSQEGSSVPLIRQKLKRILELEGLPSNSHDYKEVVSIVDSMPKTELFQYPIEVLRKDINLILSIQGRSELKVRYFLDPLKHLISILIVMPRERYTSGARAKIMTCMEKLFRSQDASAEYHTTTTDFPLYVLHILLPNPGRGEPAVTIEQLRSAVSEIILTWEDLLVQEFEKQEPTPAVARFAPYYAQALPDWYKAAIRPSEATVDMQVLDRLSPEHSLEATLEAAPSEAGGDLYYLKLYKQGAGLTLSAILPFLENLGFSIVHETVTPLTTRSGLSAALYKLQVRTRIGKSIDLKRAEKVLLPALTLVLSGSADNDRLNELMLFPGLTHREVAILRVLTHYLWQIKASTSDQAIVSALVENPPVAAKLVEFFVTKFDPKIYPGDVAGRSKRLEQIQEEFATELKSVTQLTHDRTLRRLNNVVDASVRTNYFRVPDDNRICLKIDCKRIERMPTPRPFFEIFVNAPDFEGVHLRGGKVARGGIRWSDREDDYRTEVLGLMKTQMIKNSIIIPVGAKGGFVLRQRPTNPAELGAAVKACYTRFIRSLLEVTDNRIGGQVVHPENCVVYDPPDPYFVVAADRGTATFSDTANNLAMTEFNFWLGDAFASGGSNGYDHKKLAITSRGVWETVCRHFREIGIDPEQQEFTVVGIGDMSGDVFGNGLLRSRKAKLLAAFDHRHIFLDPTPDPEISYRERLRMFQLPASKWSDYDASLISKGGGVYPRSQKEITLSPEIQQKLGIQTPVISGQELVRAILKAPVDLLWNGGIGTYFKAAEEDDLAVGDRTNDEVRVDARDLRVKIVGEGGNLGFTQLARIEYSKIGGHINTDAVDNSGGVNLSDLEVNLKILLSAPVARGELKFDERNKLLNSLADEVCLKVISRNRSQSCALSLGVRRSRKNLAYLRGFMMALEQEGLLDRKGEFLPDEETMKHRIQLKAGLTRPELAILIGYSKMSLFNAIINSDLPEQPFLQKYLFNYFPKLLCEKFPADIANHPLRREIIATELANAVVERMGASFTNRSAEESGNSRLTVLSAFIAADAIVDADELTRSLAVLDTANSTRQHLLVLMRLTSSIDNMTRWLLDHPREDMPTEQVVKRYGDSFRLLIRETDALTSQIEKNRFREACKQLIMNGVPRDLAQAVSSLAYSTVYLDIIEGSITSKAEVLEMAKLFSQLYLVLHIRPLLEQAADVEASDRWEESALRTLTNDVRRAIARLALAVVQQKGSASLEGMESFLQSRKEIITRFQSTYQEFSGRPLSVPALLIMTNQLFTLSRV